MKTAYLPKTPEGRRWHLVEEMGEVAKDLGKAGRFGLDAVAPEGCPEAGTTPRQRLIYELEDLTQTIAAVRADLNGEVQPCPPGCGCLKCCPE
jgi:hypothetical protein